MMETVLVGVIVTVALLQSLRTLLPFTVRVSLARRLKGKMPDRLVIWFAGQGACDACAGRDPFNVKDQRTK